MVDYIKFSDLYNRAKMTTSTSSPPMTDKNTVTDSGTVNYLIFGVLVLYFITPACITQAISNLWQRLWDWLLFRPIVHGGTGCIDGGDHEGVLLKLHSHIDEAINRLRQKQGKKLHDVHQHTQRSFQELSDDITKIKIDFALKGDVGNVLRNFEEKLTVRQISHDNEFRKAIFEHVEGISLDYHKKLQELQMLVSVLTARTDHPRTQSTESQLLSPVSDHVSSIGNVTPHIHQVTDFPDVTTHSGSNQPVLSSHFTIGANIPVPKFDPQVDLASQFIDEVETYMRQ